MKTIEQIKAELDAKIPTSAISERIGGGGKRLSYLEGHYVIDRMNQIFGHGNWEYRTLELTKVVEKEVTNGRGQTGLGVAYLAEVEVNVYARGEHGNRLTLASFNDVGAGKGTDFGMGLEAHESAVKEAVTDGVKRCCKNLGQSMGLALYDKSGKGIVDDEIAEIVPQKITQAVSAVIKDATSGQPTTIKADVALPQLIRNKFKIAKSNKKLDEAAMFRKLEADYGVTKLEELDESQARQVLAFVEQHIQ